MISLPSTIIFGDLGFSSTDSVAIAECTLLTLADAELFTPKLFGYSNTGTIPPHALTTPALGCGPMQPTRTPRDSLSVCIIPEGIFNFQRKV